MERKRVAAFSKQRSRAAAERVLKTVLFQVLLLVAINPAASHVVANPLDQTETEIRAAVSRALSLIEASAAEYLEHRECFSCHHQALPVLALTEARERGFRIDAENLQKQLRHTADHLLRGKKNYSEGRGQGGQADTAGYALWALAAGDWPPDEVTAAVVHYLSVRHKIKGHWQCSSNRPPSEVSDLATTYLALRALTAFRTQDQAESIAERQQSARRWLLAQQPKDTEDCVFRLRALSYLGEKDAARTSAKELIGQQRDDGGWAQTTDLESDAYATGTALVALHQAGGVAVDDPEYQRGVEFLLQRQLEDGSWHVHSRSKPFQTYFESGFPHGPDQFISMAASCWAATALVLAAGQEAGEPTWNVGLARAKITPDEPVRMSGYASRTEPSQGVAHDLYAKAMAFQDSEGQQAVLITSDVIGFTAEFAESTCRRIIEKTGLKRFQILLNSSHTHTGPALGLDEAKLDFPADQAAATVRYSRRLQDKLVGLAESSLRALQPARLSWSVGVATFVMNRREFTERGVRLGVNPRGLVDRSVPVLRIDSLDGKLRAVLFGAACHNTTLTGNNLQISGDFAGYAQALIERTHPEAQAMFMQGCAGDANPYPRGSEEIARLHGRSLGEEVLRVLESERAPVRGPLRAELEHLDLPLAAALSPDEIGQLAAVGGWRQFVGDAMQEVLTSGNELPSTYRTSVAVWQFGQDLTLVALPGEVVVDYVTFLGRELGPRQLWIAAYSNDVFGYLPSARVLKEGGYETRGLYAGGIGFFAPRAQDVVIQKVRELAESVGRAQARAN